MEQENEITKCQKNESEIYKFYTFKSRIQEAESGTFIVRIKLHQYKSDKVSQKT